MVWKHLKKPAILAASLALTIGIAPMAAFADEAAPEGADNTDIVAQADETAMVAQDDSYDWTRIDSVAVTVTPPVAGTTSATDPAAKPDGQHYSVPWSGWVDDEGVDERTDVVTFVAGDTYKMLLNVKADTGYFFPQEQTQVTVTGGTFEQITGSMNQSASRVWDNVLERYIETEEYSGITILVSVVAAAAQPGAEDSATDGGASEPENPPATEPPTVAESEPAATEAAAPAPQATTSSANTTASTLPKTADALPVALFGGIALMSALVLVMAWRLRRN